MVSLTFERNHMQEQLIAHAKGAALLRAAADAIEVLDINASLVESLREDADTADEQVARLEHNIADATTRLALTSRGLPDPGAGPAPFQ